MVYIVPQDRRDDDEPNGSLPKVDVDLTCHTRAELLLSLFRLGALAEIVDESLSIVISRVVEINGKLTSCSLATDDNPNSDVKYLQLSILTSSGESSVYVPIQLGAQPLSFDDFIGQEVRLKAVQAAQLFPLIKVTHGEEQAAAFENYENEQLRAVIELRAKAIYIDGQTAEKLSLPQHSEAIAITSPEHNEFAWKQLLRERYPSE